MTITQGKIKPTYLLGDRMPSQGAASESQHVCVEHVESGRWNEEPGSQGAGGRAPRMTPSPDNLLETERPKGVECVASWVGCSRQRELAIQRLCSERCVSADSVVEVWRSL